MRHLQPAGSGIVLIACSYCGGTWGQVEELEPSQDRLRVLSSIATKPKLSIVCGMCGRDQ